MSLFCKAALNSGECILLWTVLQCLGEWSLDTCMKSIILIGVFAETQDRCQPVLQSSTEQWGMHFALDSAAVPWSLVSAHLHEEQISTGVFAVTQACCQAGLQSSTEQWGMHSALDSAAVPWSLVSAHLYEEQNTHRCICSDTSLLSAWFAEQH